MMFFYGMCAGWALGFIVGLLAGAWTWAREPHP
jgi:hypothetical protein